MGDKTAIQWADASWNPTTGCTAISPGCDHCYADAIAKRLQAMGQPRYRNGFALTLHEDVLSLPLRWTKPRKIFVNSMSDWCHEDIPDEFILKMFETMLTAKQHTYQLLTKRAPRMVRLVPAITDLIESRTGSPVWPAHLWFGVTVESYAQRGRITHLEKVPAAVRFISYEPALGPLGDVPLTNVQWLICGAESGHDARPMPEEWAREARDLCQRDGVKFFLKQYATPAGKKIPLPELDGRIWNEFPG